MLQAIKEDGPAPLVELTRTRPGAPAVLVESYHGGSLVVVDEQGDLLAWVGDPFQVTYLRSAAKPFQVLPTVESGALERFGLGDPELAIMCGSHHGTQEHIQIVQGILDRIGLQPTALMCGVHWPIDEEAARRLAVLGSEPDARHNNCSGKHAGMLTLARHQDHTIDDYTQINHPVQRMILQRLATLTDLPSEGIAWAPDGCTVPTFAIPLANAALAYARMASPQAASSCRRVVAAMQAYPHLVSGRGALDDILLRAGRGRIVCKGGAEGFEGLGVLAPHGRALGIALKIADGNPRAKGPVIVSILEQLDLVDGHTLADLADLRCPVVKNRRDQVVGEIRAVLTLQKQTARES